MATKPKITTSHEEALSLLKGGLGPELILTGSRRWGHATLESDWDFCISTKRYKAWKDWFKYHGFELLCTTHYDDEDTIEIWEKEDTDDLFGPTKKIQITISRDFEGKKRIYKWLDDRPALVAMYYTVPKQDRTKVWRYLHVLKNKGDI
jgi:hypothetical protein